MKKLIVAAALLIALAHAAPTRLLILAGESMIVHPGAQQLTTDDSKYWEAQELEMRLEVIGYSVTYRSMNGVYGLTMYDSKKIFIEESMHWSDRYRTLLHEAGHVLRPPYLEGANGEMFAEGVAFIACGCGYRETARYLASNRPALLALIAYSGDIYRVAGFLKF